MGSLEKQQDENRVVELSENIEYKKPIDFVSRQNDYKERLAAVCKKNDLHKEREKESGLDLQIQIVNYKSIKYLKTCVDDVINNMMDNQIDYCLVVWDNGSLEDFSALLNKYEMLDRIRFYFSQKNLGYGTAQNRLSQDSESEFLLFLNPDVEIRQNKSIEKLFDFMKKNQDVAVVVPRVRSLEKNNPFEKLKYWPWKFIMRDYLEKNFDFPVWQDKNFLENKVLQGSVMMVRKDVFDLCGGFNEKLFLYFEESDLLKKMHQKGFRSGMLYDSEFIHHVGKSDMSPAERIVEYKKSRKVLLKDWFGAKKAEKMEKNFKTRISDYLMEKYYL